MIELVSDVGGGKTTFTKGLAAGLGCSDDISSPTFTVSRVYPARDDLHLHHFDFYRMNGHDITTDELNEVTDDPKAVTVVEWAGSGEANLPGDRIRVSLTPGESENKRDIVIECTQRLKYVLEDIK